ncbi:pyridoxal-phosphate dependent enzyme [Georgenia phoenicis]|uniref:1-aminocyclopropane-1-carboxylate deaminase/D-cysteine desulfhydrase n=1 Tax=unclassified Georgenia TaxID=2626815 RepID=UPI0039AEF977
MFGESPVERFDRLGEALEVELLAKRDDLLPFPLAGNKFRKLSAELAQAETDGAVWISNGGVSSNHCRTLALMAAQRGVGTHLVLHGQPSADDPSLAMYARLGASYDVVPPSDIASTIEARASQYAAAGLRPEVIPGGCHTRLGAISYRDATRSVIASVRPDVIVVASGTGATQGGIIAGAETTAVSTRVIGVSVARSRARGEGAVAEAAVWAGSERPRVEFTDEYVDGGYGVASSRTHAAVRLGWQHGLPLDPTYTGKAFAGLLGLVADGTVARGSRVLFWHTGGLWNALLATHPSPEAGTS